jgi:hypothetical protein
VAEPGEGLDSARVPEKRALAAKRVKKSFFMLLLLSYSSGFSDNAPFLKGSLDSLEKVLHIYVFMRAMSR